MTNNRFVRLVRGYGFQTRRTKKSFAGPVREVLALRNSFIEQAGFSPESVVRLKAEAARIVHYEYAVHDREFTLTKPFEVLTPQ